MGKATRLLKILVDESVYASAPEKFNTLEEKGHTLDVMGDKQIVPSVARFRDYDLILSPKAWRAFDASMLDVTIKAARKQRYG